MIKKVNITTPLALSCWNDPFDQRSKMMTEAVGCWRGSFFRTPREPLRERARLFQLRLNPRGAPESQLNPTG